MSGVIPLSLSAILARKYTRPVVEYAENIAGWMTYNELAWLARQAQKHFKIVEIGSYMGRSTRALGDNTPGFVVAVDDFKGPRDVNLPSIIRDNLFEMFVYAIGDLGVRGKVMPVIADHSDIDIDFSPDMVFIDGSHEYEDVKRDINYWLPRVVKGGLICGHDFTNLAPVRQAIQEELPKAKVAKGTSIWFYKLK